VLLYVTTRSVIKEEPLTRLFSASLKFL